MKKFIFLSFIISFFLTIHSYTQNQNQKYVPVLCYHHISTDSNSTFSRSAYAVTKKQFEIQMNFLKENGFKTISLNELIDFINKKPVSLPDKPVVITFDDGLNSQFHTALPILKKNGFKAVYFIYPSVILSKSKRIRKWHMTASMIKKLHHEEGMEIESHSFYHPLMHRESESVNRLQFRNSKNWLENLTGKKVKYFAYPFGSYTQEVIRIGQEEGYRGMFTINTGTAFGGSNPYSINRFMITRNHNIKAFANYVRSIPLVFKSIHPADGSVQKVLNKIIVKISDNISRKDYRIQILLNGGPVSNIQIKEGFSEISFYPKRVFNGLNNVQIMLLPKKPNLQSRIGSWTFVVKHEGTPIARRKTQQIRNRTAQ